MSRRRRFSYAQARLFLGISNVGFWVCLALAGLVFGLAGRFFPTEALTGKKLILPLATFLLGYVVLQAPFDFLGGFILPGLYRRCYSGLGDFFTNWVRGVAGQAAVLFGIGLTWIFYAQWLVWLGMGWMLALLFLQMFLARIIGDFHCRGENAWKSQDEAFTGGITGIPGMQQTIFVTGRGQRLRAMDERRRRHLQKMLLPGAGVGMALAFNLTGILLVSQLVSHPLNTVSGLVELALWFTLWSFFGLLILPSLNRPAVYAGDYALFTKGVRREEFEHYLQYDSSQSGEESRSPWVERIFHPVPSPANRLAHWGRAPAWSGGWHAARYAIYLSWAGLSLLNRSVHCNIGKPNVWVILPCD